MESMLRSEPNSWRTRGIVLRCDDDTFALLLNSLKSNPDCYLIYEKTSGRRLILKEEGW